MERYNALTMPLSNKPELREIQDKILHGQELNLSEKLKAGRDHPVKEINGIPLKPDFCYRAISKELYELYQKEGLISGVNEEDEYYEEEGYNNNKGVDWYLGGAALRYGNIVIECPADKEYFIPAADNGCGLSYDPNVRFMKSSGYKKRIPFSMITRTFDMSQTKDQVFQEKRAKENLLMSVAREAQLSTIIYMNQNEESVGVLQR